MTDLDKQIADLEAQLATLHDKRRQRMSRYGSPAELRETDFFTVLNPDELNLAALPELARFILDALPVQVFIKQAAVDPENGRRYTYINQTARAILGWSEEKAKSVYDSEAFTGGTSNPEWRTMFEGETETLESRKSRRRELRWTANTEQGEAWRLNRVTEIPILKSGQEEPVGFCAIAQDIEFQLFAATHSQLRRIFRHEYGNLAASVLRYVKRAERIIKRHSEQENEREQRNQVLENLRAIEGFLVVAANVADALYVAVGQIDQKSRGTVGTVASEIRALFEKAPFTVTVTYEENVRLAWIPKPEAVTGLLVQLIGNAEKHYDESAKHIEILVIAGQVNGEVIWEISNRCQQLEGRLDFDSATPSGQFITREHFGAKIMGDIVKRAYGVEPCELIEFPPGPTDGWVHVKLRCPAVED